MHHLIHLLLLGLSLLHTRLRLLLQMSVCKMQQMRRQPYHVLRHTHRRGCKWLSQGAYKRRMFGGRWLTHRSLLLR
jgi:hypothetical protein